MFVTRLISGVLLLAMALFLMGVGGMGLALVLLAISMIAYRELTKALRCHAEEETINGLEIIGLLASVGFYSAVYFGQGVMWLLVGIVFLFLAEMFVYVILFPKFHISQVMTSIFSFLYAPVMLSFIYLTRELPMGFYTVWLILISSWGSDTCAYAVGKLIGRKKIFPVLSPNKSLEGCLGGVAGAALLGALYGAILLRQLFPGQPIAVFSAIICAVGAIMSMLGDLAASAMKRNHQLKDYGTLIPGHGGMMDRFDSMIVTAPMVYFLVLILYQVQGF